MTKTDIHAMKTDFSKLYSQLDLTPDCSLEELKHAYRRRIAELHPDRQPFAAQQLEHAIPLSDLNSIYAMAMRFHKQHGRLPGGKLSPGQHVRTSPDGSISNRSASPTMDTSTDEATGPETGHRSSLGILLVVLVLALAVFLDSSSAEARVKLQAPTVDGIPA